MHDPGLAVAGEGVGGLLQRVEAGRDDRPVVGVGEDVEVRFTRYLRPERKFDSLEDLVRQIELDVRQARELCAI